MATIRLFRRSAKELGRGCDICPLLAKTAGVKFLEVELGKDGSLVLCLVHELELLRVLLNNYVRRTKKGTCPASLSKNLSWEEEEGPAMVWNPTTNKYESGEDLTGENYSG